MTTFSFNLDVTTVRFDTAAKIKSVAAVSSNSFNTQSTNSSTQVNSNKNAQNAGKRHRRAPSAFLKALKPPKLRGAGAVSLIYWIE